MNCLARREELVVFSVAAAAPAAAAAAAAPPSPPSPVALFLAATACAAASSAPGASSARIVAAAAAAVSSSSLDGSDEGRRPFPSFTRQLVRVVQDHVGGRRRVRGRDGRELRHEVCDVVPPGLAAEAQGAPAGHASELVYRVAGGGSQRGRGAADDVGGLASELGEDVSVFFFVGWGGVLMGREKKRSVTTPLLPPKKISL